MGVDLIGGGHVFNSLSKSSSNDARGGAAAGRPEALDLTPHTD